MERKIRLYVPRYPYIPLPKTTNNTTNTTLWTYSLRVSNTHKGKLAGQEVFWEVWWLTLQDWNVTAIKRNMKGVPSSSHANVFTARITTNSIQGWIHTVQSSRPKPSFVNFTQVTHYVNQRNQSVTHLLKTRYRAQWDSHSKLIKEGTKRNPRSGSCWNNAPRIQQTALLVQKRSEWDNTYQTFPPCLKNVDRAPDSCTFIYDFRLNQGFSNALPYDWDFQAEVYWGYLGRITRGLTTANI